MQILDMNELVDVGAVFGKDKIKLKWFVWNNKKYDIKSTTYTWKNNKGEAKLIHFSVTDGANFFDLCFNKKTLLWHLEKVTME